MSLSRLRTFYLTLVFLYLIVISRLFYWQVIKYPDFLQKNINQNYKPSVTEPDPGKIYDRLGNPLLLNETKYQLSIYKPDLKIPVSELKQMLQLEGPQIENFITNPNIKWTTITSKLYSYLEKQTLSDPGLKFSSINQRFYPEGELARQVIDGVSNYYQRQLQGKTGFVWQTVDATGKTTLSKPGWYVEPVDGLELNTSLDRQVQFEAEKRLRQGIVDYSADSGSIVIMSPQTGSIISMTTLFSAETASNSSHLKNPSISNLFEPGSIFKPLVVAMGLDSQSIPRDFICSRCGSPKQIGEYSIGNWDNSFHPNSNLEDIIKNSDNVGMSYIVEKIGLNTFLKYFKDLGLNRKTGIDLPQEVKPITKSYWPEIDLATASFGQGFAVTQIQMISAFNTLANDGELVKPRIGVQTVKSKSTHVFKKETATQVKKILKYSVENGVVAKLKPTDLEVCAKSGTSQVAVKGGYSESSTIASYIGFSPCDNPKFTMIVTINNPRTSPWGSSTAAPIWYDLAKRISSLL